MRGGEILEVLLDDGEPIVTVSRSAKEDGYKITRITQVENYFRVLLKRRHRCSAPKHSCNGCYAGNSSEEIVYSATISMPSIPPKKR
jgi:hypothetical protein